MACCSGRCLLITLCLTQLIAVIERQVFDFLGYMWAPIIGNFLQIIFVIIGLFGAIQYRHRVVTVYTVWCLIWLGWNVFVICFYLEVGILSRDSSVLNIGTGNKSWWRENGIGCTTNATCVQPSSPVSDSCIEGCLLQYYYVEIIQAGAQCLLALIGFCVSCYVIYVFTEEDDSSQPVHDELEYIKMRYRSPARSSFRDPKPQKAYNMNKAYETMTSQTTTYSSTTQDPSNTTNYTDETSLEMTTLQAPDSTRSNRRMLSDDSSNNKNNRKNQKNKQQQQGDVIISSNKNSIGKNPDLWASESPDLNQRSGGPDFGYESYDSRNQLVVGSQQGQTVI